MLCEWLFFSILASILGDPHSSVLTLFCLQVEREYISYIHDGSETEKDSFTIVANQTEISKHSLPCVAYVNITPVNDETPVVRENNGLKVRIWLCQRDRQQKCSFDLVTFDNFQQLDCNYSSLNIYVNKTNKTQYTIDSKDGAYCTFT